MNVRLSSLALPLILAASLAGCATPTSWVKDGGTQQVFDADARTCIYEAAKAAGSPDVTSATALYSAQEKRKELEGLCMQAKGWQLVRKTN